MSEVITWLILSEHPPKEDPVLRIMNVCCWSLARAIQIMDAGGIILAEDDAVATRLNLWNIYGICKNISLRNIHTCTYILYLDILKAFFKEHPALGDFETTPPAPPNLCVAIWARLVSQHHGV